MLYQITAYSFDTARCRALSMRRTCRHIMHVMHTGYSMATQCDALDAASVCCSCSLDSTALDALELLSACSRSTRASQLQVHLRLELLLRLVAADLVAALDSASAA